MLDYQSTVEYLRKSLALKDPQIETDEAYKFTDDDLWDIIQLVIPNHNPPILLKISQRMRSTLLYYLLKRKFTID